MMRLPAALIATLITVFGLSVVAQQGPGPGAPPPPGQGRPGGPGRGGPGRGGRGGPGNFGPIPVPASNPLTIEAVTLGRKLFFDPQLSVDRTVSCATCHDPAKAFTDSRVVARGVHGIDGPRNTPSLVNAAYGRTFFWDGRAASLEEQVLGPIVNPKEMGLTQEELERRAGLTAGEVAAAIASYVRTIRSRDSRYDWFVMGQPGMLTALERTGLDVFRGRGQCGQCHGGPNFTDGQFHVTGVGWQGDYFTDSGRFVVTKADGDLGAFKTPTLREVALTAPYMHDGSLATLDDVVEFYSRGGRQNPYQDPRIRPRRFSADEKQALLAFLRALSGRVTEGF